MDGELRAGVFLLYHMGKNQYGVHEGIGGELTSPSKMSSNLTSDSLKPKTRLPRTDFSSGERSRPNMGLDFE